MTPLFVESSIEGITYLRGEKVTNRPVNLSLCKSIEKSNYAWYPDNRGKPAIRFNGCDVEWVYNQESMRDKDYNRIKNNNF
jgi:hypothetical protein